MKKIENKRKTNRSSISKKTVKSYMFNMLANDKVFKLKCVKNQDIMKEIMAWKLKFRLTKEDMGDVIERTANIHDGEKIADEITEMLLQKAISNKKKYKEFSIWFYNFFDKYGLSKIWEKSILRYIACGYYCPPFMKTIDISISQEENVVLLKLQPTTSSIDLQNSWFLVKRELIKLKRSRDKKIRAPKKFHENLKELLCLTKLKKTYYYEPSTDQFSPKTDLDVLNEYYADQKKQKEIQKNPKKYLAKARKNRERLKDFIK